MRSTDHLTTGHADTRLAADDTATGHIGPAARRRAVLFTAVVISGLSVLTACGPGTGGGAAAAGTKDDGVASLVTASPTGDTGTATSMATTKPPKQDTLDAKRPQLRLDSTPEEYMELRMAYATCLNKHGRPQKATLTAKDQAAEDAARRACADKEPLLPPEMDPARNPHYADAIRAEVRCLKDRGLKVHVVPAPGSDPNRISWAYDAMAGPDVDIQKIQDDCRVKAFGGGRALGPGPA